MTNALISLEGHACRVGAPFWMVRAISRTWQYLDRHFATRKVGGIWFFRCYRLRLSFCVARGESR